MFAPVRLPGRGNLALRVSSRRRSLLALCTLVFVNPMQSDRALKVLRHALGGKRFEYVLALLAFIRTAHYWTVVHPGIEMEDDVLQLMATHKELAALLLQEPDPWSA